MYFNLGKISVLTLFFEAFMDSIMIQQLLFRKVFSCWISK